MYICACTTLEVKYRETKESLHDFLIPAVYTPLLPCWNSETGRVGLTDTAMLIKMWLSAMEKQGLECFVHLEGPSPWLAAL